MANLRQLLSALDRLANGSSSRAVERALLVLFCLAIYVPTLFRGFIDPDETRYTEIAREMVESGDWIVPHLNYVSYLFKPPLTYWLVAASIKVFGLHPWSVRLAPLLAAILGVLVTYELGSAVSSRRVGLVGALLLATAGEYFALAVTLVTDMVFAAFLAGAWWTFWRYYQEGGRPKRWIILFWFFLALGCLTKGPLALVLVGFAVGLFLVLRGDWSFVLRLRPIAGAAILAAVNLPWVIALWSHDPRHVIFFYVQMHLWAFKSGGVQHPGPFYYYLGAIPLGLLPWTFPAIAALVVAVRQIIHEGRRQASPGVVWLLSIFIGGFFFLSASKAKLGTYCLPLFPPICLIAAEYLGKMDGRSRWVQLLLPIQSLIAFVALAFYLIGPEKHGFLAAIQNPAFPAIAIWAIVLAAGLLVASAISLRGRFSESLLILGIMASLLLPVALILTPHVATWRTAAARFCEQFKTHLAAADVVIITDSAAYSVPLSLQRRVAVLGDADELGAGFWVENHPGKPVPPNPIDLESVDIGSPYLLDSAGLRKLWTSDRWVCLFTEPDVKGRLRFLVENLWVLAGEGKLVLITNRDPSSVPASAALPP